MPPKAKSKKPFFPPGNKDSTVAVKQPDKVSPEDNGTRNMTGSDAPLPSEYVCLE